VRGLVQLGVVAVDGTKVAAAATHHATRSHDEIAREIPKQAAELDAAEDEELALRREAPESYRELPGEQRAQVLVAALRELPHLNDFGWMEPDGHGHDRTAAQALLELGDAARAPLVELLDDDRPAPLAGSEAATVSSTYGYRRSDYAHRYLSKLLRRNAPFAAEPAQRDAAIAALRNELRN